MPKKERTKFFSPNHDYWIEYYKPFFPLHLIVKFSLKTTSWIVDHQHYKGIIRYHINFK